MSVAHTATTAVGSGVRVGSLCTGYGGLDLAVELVLGGHLAWYAETDPHASRVLAARWPLVPNLGDIRTVDWNTVPGVDIVTAGFPCQDISNAGKRVGIHGVHSSLWTTVADAVRALQPTYVYVENVAALLRRGLDVVHRDLATLGYDTRWLCLRASDIGAAHRRDRLFLLYLDTSTLSWWRSQLVAWQSAGGSRLTPCRDAHYAPQLRGVTLISARYAAPLTDLPRSVHVIKDVGWFCLLVGLSDRRASIPGPVQHHELSLRVPRVVGPVHAKGALGREQRS